MDMTFNIIIGMQIESDVMDDDDDAENDEGEEEDEAEDEDGSDGSEEVSVEDEEGDDDDDEDSMADNISDTPGSENHNEGEDDSSSDGSGDESERLSSVMKESLRLKKEFEDMQKSEISLIKTTEVLDDQVEKGKHAHTQLRLWDSLVEMRIRLQRVVSGANRLPRTDSLRRFQGASHVGLAATQSGSGQLLSRMADLQDQLAEQFPSVFSNTGKSVKRLLPDDDFTVSEASLASRLNG